MAINSSNFGDFHAIKWLKKNKSMLTSSNLNLVDRRVLSTGFQKNVGKSPFRGREVQVPEKRLQKDEVW